MSVSTIGQIETSVVESQSLTATAVAVATGATILFDAEFDNTANSVDVWVHLYDAAPTVGTTHPDMSIKIAAGKKGSLPPMDANGISFPTNIYAAATLAGGKGGTTSPVNAVTATWLID